MTKSRIRFAVAAFLLLVGVVLVCLPRAEPSYNGIQLSQWLDKGGPMAAFSLRISPEQETAIRHMGPDALPWLVNFIDAEPWFNSRRLLKILRFSPKWAQTRWGGRLMQKAQENEFRSQARAAAAANALRALGAAARPALPRLLEIYRTRPDWIGAYRVPEVLAEFGPDVLPPVLAMMSDPGFSNKVSAIQLIGRMRHLGTAAASAVPIVCDCLAQSDLSLQTASIDTLGALHARADISVPALVSALTNAVESSNVVVSRKCAESLGQFDSAASNSVPDLCYALRCSDGITSEEAARSLGRIRGLPDIAVPALIEYFNAENRRHCKYALEGLNGYGVVASPAAPLARQALADPDHDTRALAASFLQMLRQTNTAGVIPDAAAGFDR
ncbi:MAG TPA: hypothetical protein VKY92_28070 [Verrucomicrobiae bacterium]|nr:hypothetical protein [Verrucomicrobiae bacterium]